MGWDQLLSSEMHPINVIINHIEVHIVISIDFAKRFDVHWIRSRKSVVPQNRKSEETSPNNLVFLQLFRSRSRCSQTMAHSHRLIDAHFRRTVHN